MLALLDENTAYVSSHGPGSWVYINVGGYPPLAFTAQDGWQCDGYSMRAIVDAEPVPEGKYVTATEVVVTDGVPKYVHVLEDTPPPDLAAFTALKRWEKEVGGIIVAGVPVATDDRSKTMIIGARVKAEGDTGFTTAWKGSDGEFITIDAPTIIAISDAVLSHVAACFAIEKSVIDGITSGSITTTAAIDAAFG